MGCGRQRVHRLPGVLGAAGVGPRPSRGGRGADEGRRGRDQLRRAGGGGGRTGPAHLRSAALRRVGAVGELRHRGLHERHTLGPRLHWPQQDHQVRWLLPRPRRRPAGQGRVRGADPRHPHQRRCARVLRLGNPSGRLQRYGLCGAVFRVLPRRPSRHHRRASGGQHGGRAPGRGVLGRAAAGDQRQRGAAHLRRGHHWLPCRPPRRSGPLRHHPRHHHDGQDHRRRPARGRLRRKARRHGAGGALGRHVPSGHPVRQSAGRQRRYRHPPRATGAWRLRADRPDGPTAERRAGRERFSGWKSPPSSTASVRC